MTTVEILDDEGSYDLTDVEPQYDLLALREQARREGREYRAPLPGHLRLCRDSGLCRARHNPESESVF
jgi:hypothetical protein